MKEYKHLGAYGLILKDERILLIRKACGPYEGKLDLPGGTIELGERPEEALRRELMEEVGIMADSYELFDTDSVYFEWQWKEDVLVKVHHIGIFYRIFDYKNEIRKSVQITEVNDDSIGADFYEISNLKKDDLSKIAILELNKLGYELKD